MCTDVCAWQGIVCGRHVHVSVDVCVRGRVSCVGGMCMCADVCV